MGLSMSKDSYLTEQEAFWAGDFGTEYIHRNMEHKKMVSNISLFSHALRMTGPIKSCIEFGANIGLNLAALRILYPGQLQYALEINEKAAKELRNHLPDENVFEMSILDFDPQVAATKGQGYDLVLAKGFLIHINPDYLVTVYEKLYTCTRKYLLIAEYYNPTPVMVNYRGHDDRLFKRDFAGELMDKYPDLVLLDYGFVYHRDPSFPQDDITWFLMKK
jgi:spore coat polysaccharide biosynthesis protein SpsF